MSLPNDIARCDGLLPKTTWNGQDKITLWANDCPKRDQCARYLQGERDMESGDTAWHPYTTHNHKPSEVCPDFIQDTEDAE